jgi:hypothetical protein
MNRPKNIILRLLLVAIPVLLAMAPAMAQTNNVFVGQSVELSVATIPGDTYTWELYTDETGINFATTPGNCQLTDASFDGGIATGPIVHITWFTPGTYFFKVTSQHSGCTMNLKIGKIIVDQFSPTVSLSLNNSSTCINQNTSIIVTNIGDPLLSLTYRVIKPDASMEQVTLNNSSGDLTSIPFTPISAGTYTFQLISITDTSGIKNAISNSVTVTVNPKPGSSRIYQYDPTNKKK